MSSKQLVMDNFLVSERASNIDAIYNVVRNCFLELYSINELVEYLKEDIMPITYDIKFKHSIRYDRESDSYKYYGSILSIEGVNLHLNNDNKIVFDVFNVDNRLVKVIINWAYLNSNYIKYILSVYNKYYAMFNYSSNKLPDTLCCYDIGNGITINVDTKGSVKLSHNYVDISENAEFKSHIICSDSKKKDIINDTYDKCQKLLLVKKDN